VRSGGLQIWSDVSQLFLTPDVPFDAHVLVANHVFRNWDARKLGPPPLWYPSQTTAASTNVAKFMRDNQALMAEGTAQLQVRDERWFLQQALVRDWRVLHAISVHWPEQFWPAFLRAVGIMFHSPPECVLQQGTATDPDSYRWFPGALINMADVALRCGDPDSPAVVFAGAKSPTRYGHTMSGWHEAHGL
jgi:hypothetical protein